MHIDLGRLPRTVELKGRVGAPEGVRLSFVEQTLLPQRLELVETADWRVVVDAIARLAVRGAPALGVAGAAAVALWACGQAEASARDGAPFDPAAFDAALDPMACEIATARPTAVNLAWGTNRVRDALVGLAGGQAGAPTAEATRALAQEAAALVRRMEREDERANRALGAHGAALLPKDARVITHCNAGSLATVFFGTALGVVYAAAEQGKIDRVHVDETRPVGQGARLTAWELARAGVPVTLQCDDMAAFLMARERIDAVVVGADRIAANGDTANKIGTYALAVAAAHHGVPFYVAAPSSTFDLSVANGDGIPIEERAACEVLPQPLEGVDVWNPAFDVTPASLVTAWITERGVLRDPAAFESALRDSEAPVPATASDGLEGRE